MAKELDTREVAEAIVAVQQDYRTPPPRKVDVGHSNPSPAEDDEITTAKGCRAKAASMRATAAMLSDPTYRARALKIAERWAALAAEYEASDGRRRG
jgi:hypothetical protein